MVDAYLSALADPVEQALRNGHAPPPPLVVPTDVRGRYWVGHDLVHFALLPPGQSDGGPDNIPANERRRAADDG